MLLMTLLCNASVTVLVGTFEYESDVVVKPTVSYPVAELIAQLFWQIQSHNEMFLDRYVWFVV
jgi:hypothetical protein